MFKTVFFLIITILTMIKIISGYMTRRTKPVTLIKLKSK